MKIETDEDMIRLLVLDISGVYTQIVNEIYETKDTEEEIRNEYGDEKYRIVRTM